jgi:hypothetical protein
MRRRPLGRAWIVLGVAVFLATGLATGATSRRDPRFHPGSVDASIYVRSDTDTTTVVSPRAHLRKAVGTLRTNLDLVYTADVWTSASIDVRTAATERIVEQRDEIVAGLDHEEGVLRFGGGYRFSREYDYLSNGGNLFLEVDAFQRTATFAARATASFDQVGRAGDEFFAERSNTFGQWLGWTQVLNKRSLLQVAYEIRATLGYQASPYRFVSIGGGLTCATPSAVCVPETLPHRRIKHAAIARARFALTERLSMGGGYRFYFDEWRVMSHTAMMDLAYASPRRLELGVEYRFYFQSAAFFYEREYRERVDRAYYTRDRELSPLHDSRLNGRIAWTKPFGKRNNALVLAALLGGTLYRYRDFIGLVRVAALEATASAGVSF